jgi:hypothetical protein
MQTETGEGRRCAAFHPCARSVADPSTGPALPDADGPGGDVPGRPVQATATSSTVRGASVNSWAAGAPEVAASVVRV